MIELNGMLMGAVIVPVLVGMFKSELADIFSDYMIYKRRGVTEGCVIALLNPYLGKWAEVEVLDYTFGLSQVDRVVTFKYVGTDRIESIPFKNWAAFRKSVVDKAV